MLGQRQCRLDPVIAADLARVSTWSVDLRYEVGFVPTREATAFLGASNAILDWVIRST